MFLQVWLSEVDGGKKFAEGTEADAKDEPARTGHYTGKNWSGDKKIARG